MSQGMETAYRRALARDRAIRGMSLLFNLELTWLAGVAGMASKSWLVGIAAFMLMMWLRRYPIFCAFMCILFTANWVIGLGSLAYTKYGWSEPTFAIGLITLIVIGVIHLRGLDELNDLYAR